MELIIKDKKYPIYFGFAALEYLDNQYALEVEGFKLGVGLNAVLAQLGLNSVVVLIHLIKAGTITENNKPSTMDLEEYIGTLEEKEYEKLFRDMENELKNQPLTRKTVLKIEKTKATKKKTD